MLVDTSDIAAVVAEKLLDLSFTDNTIQYIASDELSTNEIAEILGEAIGKSGTPWVTFTDEQAFDGMLGAGLDVEIAKDHTTMGSAIRNGLIQADYWQNKPTLGKAKLTDFTRAFAAAYNA